MSAVAGSSVRRRLRIEGTVQGVGFRPFVYRLAGELGLAGWVLNDSRGVLIEVEGGVEAVREFGARVATEAPPQAIVERVVSTACAVRGLPGFEIRASASDLGSGELDAPVAPDSATCENCLRELFDPADRRYRYPFINCTGCGPRFTIVRGVPYDRPRTTMAGFTMCAVCRAEYEDPGDRRFHAQPNACPTCGPVVTLVDLVASGERGGGDRPSATGTVAVGDDALAGAAAALRAGAIVAVKGIGGYHLACRADREDVVATLRARKHREDRPFALMAASLEVAERFVALGEHERELLCSAARPIVLAPRLAPAGGGPVVGGALVAESVAPGATELGVMLPYSPLHHLLLRDAGLGPLVMTSGNVADEPIAYRDADAVGRLAGVADVMLVHDRPIETRTDDSVARVAGGAVRFVRRSRGYVPTALSLPGGAERPVLACGAELKSTFCLAKGQRAWVSHHIGDLQNYETLQSFTEGVRHFERLFDVEPAVVAHDLHPDYLSTRYALEHDAVELVAVQHHHAHLAACLAEHGLEPGERAIGAIFDGTGFGSDGTVWGGEILFGDARSFDRIGWLRPVPMPGGERAISEPWRMACAWLDAVCEGEPDLPGPLAGQVDAALWRQVLAMSRAGVSSPMTSSAGRLFDAVAALCGIRPRVSYEGQAAIELEAACDPSERGSYPFAGLDPSPAIREVLGDLRRDVAVGAVAARFHNGLARAVVDACAAAAAERGVDRVVLSGGVFLNRRLLAATASGLARAGLRVLSPSVLPVGDGGIAFGQAAVAAAAER